MKHHIIVASFMSGKGPTGVETHFNQIISAALKLGISADLVTPHRDGRVTIGRIISEAIWRTLRPISHEYAVLWSRWIGFYRLRRRLRRMLRQSADQQVTIYAQDPLSANAALHAKADLNCRVVAVVHFNVSEAQEAVVKGETAEGGVLWRSLMKTESTVLPQLNHLIFVSEFMRRVVVDRIPTAANVAQTVIPNFPSYPEDCANEESDVAGDIISIGTLEPRKNQQFLLHVLSACNQREYRYTLTLAGNGPSRESLEHLAAKLNITEQVRFLGFVPNGAALISSHRVYCHSSQMESFGIVLTEAMARGVPVIAAPVGGIPEVFSDNVEGRYWDLDDPDGAADILICLLEDSMRLQQMSYQAKRTFDNKFHPDVLSEKWLTAITG